MTAIAGKGVGPSEGGGERESEDDGAVIWTSRGIPYGNEDFFESREITQLCHPSLEEDPDLMTLQTQLQCNAKSNAHNTTKGSIDLTTASEDMDIEENSLSKKGKGIFLRAHQKKLEILPKELLLRKIMNNI